MALIHHDDVEVRLEPDPDKPWVTNRTEIRTPSECTSINDEYFVDEFGNFDVSQALADQLCGFAHLGWVAGPREVGQAPDATDARLVVPKAPAAKKAAPAGKAPAAKKAAAEAS